MLGRSRFAADLLEQAPESVQFLRESGGVQPGSRAEIFQRMQSAARRQESLDDAVLAARRIRRTELFRIAVADLEGKLTLHALGVALSDLAEALMEVALDATIRAPRAADRPGPDDPAARRGHGPAGRPEIGYGSDADVLFVHDPVDGRPSSRRRTRRSRSCASSSESWA